jgi:hypothetical protein
MPRRSRASWSWAATASLQHPVGHEHLAVTGLEPEPQQRTDAHRDRVRLRLAVAGECPGVDPGDGLRRAWLPPIASERIPRAPSVSISRRGTVTSFDGNRPDSESTITSSGPSQPSGIKRIEGGKADVCDQEVLVTVCQFW